ncbi:MAG TPA: outer membrane beta-barrel protein [Verrucomicrobiae bacterium]|nr:outer membrane beta-barrel protein [Verrucomicrobiae bacterium]
MFFTHSKQAPVRRTASVERVLRHLALLSCSVASGAMGQGVLAPLPTVPGQMPSPPVADPLTGGITTGAAGGAEAVAQGTAAMLPGLATGELLRWGDVHVRTHVTYQFLDGTGIQSSPGQSGNVISHTINPGATVSLGSHWTLDYEPTLVYYSGSRFRNSVNQAVSLTGATSYNNWTLGLSQGYSRSDQPLAETASQTASQSYSAGLNANYDFNNKWSLEMNGGAGLTFVDSSQNKTNFQAPLSDSQNYFSSAWMNYQFDSRLSAAVGVSGGYSDQNGGFQSVSEQLLGRIILRPGAKLSISADGGVENEHFLNTGGTVLWNPVMAANIDYNMFEKTTLTLSANRSVEASLFQNQVTEDTTVGLGLIQRLFGWLQMSLAYSHSIDDFIGSTTGSSQRTDTGNSYQASLSTSFLHHGSISTFYQYSQSSSTQQGFSYSSHQAGVTLTWAY